MPRAKEPPDNANATASAPSMPSGKQASDDMTKKITELVHAGKYAEAQQLTTGLRVAYPDDQRLIKAKGLIEKLLAASGRMPRVASFQPGVFMPGFSAYPFEAARRRLFLGGMFLHCLEWKHRSGLACGDMQTTLGRTRYQEEPRFCNPLTLYEITGPCARDHFTSA